MGWNGVVVFRSVAQASLPVFPTFFPGRLDGFHHRDTEGADPPSAGLWRRVYYEGTEIRTSHVSRGSGLPAAMEPGRGADAGPTKMNEGGAAGDSVDVTRAGRPGCGCPYGFTTEPQPNPKSEFRSRVRETCEANPNQIRSPNRQILPEKQKLTDGNTEGAERKKRLVFPPELACFEISAFTRH